MDLDRLWRQFVEQLVRPKERYGEPGRRLTNLDRDSEDAGSDLANRFDAAYPQSPRSMFDPTASQKREAARHRLSRELYDTWRQGEPYSPWVAKAARNVGI